ncbi:MAG: hypothetical protein K2X38_05110 [Gemmataceae bacterium]|nr:hypothetical protein [Gemmataceae bacterium]
MGWFSTLFARKTARSTHPRRTHSFRPRMESLEARDVMAAALGVGPVGDTVAVRPSFTWQPIAGADHYEVWVDDLTSKTSQAVRNFAIVGTSWESTVSLTVGNNYRWWVRGWNLTHTIPSDWSAQTDFTVSAMSKVTPLAPSGSTSSGSPTFSWTGIQGAAYYDVWVDNVSTGQSQVVRNQTATGTSWTPSYVFSTGDSYRWWIRALDSTKTNIGAWSDSLDFSVSAIAKPNLTAPLGNGIASTKPTFTWDVVTGATRYDIWVNNSTTGESQVLRNRNATTNSWTASTALTPGQTYRWWVQAYDASGNNPSEWSDTGEFRIDPIGTPTPTAPAGAGYNARPTFDWSAVAAAKYYDLWIDNLTTGKSGILRSRNLTTNSWASTFTFQGGDTYRWWVRASDASGAQFGPWSTSQDFTIGSIAAPTLSNPNGAISNAQPAFSWSAVTGADKYDVWVDDLTAGKSAVLRNQSVNGTTWTPSGTLESGRTYRWWVRGIDSTGTNRGTWSSSLDFTISAVATPTPTGPNGVAVNAGLAFTWNAAAGADKYDVWVDNLSTGQSQVLRNQNVAGTAWTPGVSLQEGQTYRWWVRGMDNSGTNKGSWSVYQDFKVSSIGIATLLGPTGDTPGAGPNFTWTAVSGATKYDIWVNDVTTGKSAVFRDQAVVGTNWTPPTPLVKDRSYRWWVRALDTANNVTGEWSAAASFKVTALATPVLIGPAGASVALPTFTWNAVAGASTYDVWVNNVTTGQAQVMRNANAVGTSWTPVVALTAGQSYRWWVQAIDSTGTITSDWSGYLDFSVIAAV